MPLCQPPKPDDKDIPDTDIIAVCCGFMEAHTYIFKISLAIMEGKLSNSVFPSSQEMYLIINMPT